MCARNPVVDKTRAMSLVVLAAALIAGATLSLAFFYGPSWMNGSDNYIYLSQSRLLAAGKVGMLAGGPDGVKYLIFIGIALFIKLFGNSLLSASLSGVAALELTILSVYLIGKEISGRPAGALAALALSFFPMAVVQSSNIGDDVPMMLFVTAAVMLAVMAMKRKDMRLFCASGFAATFAYLIVPEALIGSMFVLLVAAAHALLARNTRKGTKRYASVYYAAAGIALGVLAVMAVSVAFSGNPLNVFSIDNQFYAGWTTTPAISGYVPYIFPGMATAKLYGYADGSATDFNTYLFDLFGYALAAGSLYLVATGKAKTAALPAAWFAFMFLYIGLGSQSASRYVFLPLDLRYLIILAPAVALIIGLALKEAFSASWRARGAKRPAYTAATLMLLAVLLTSSFFDIRYLQLSQRKGVLPLAEIGAYLNALPANATILGPDDIPWATYVDSRSYLALGYVRDQNCTSALKLFGKELDSSYIVAEPSNNMGQCGFTAVFVPQADNALSKYSAFDNWGINFYDVEVYRKA